MKVINKQIPFLIFTKKELETMLDYSDKHNDKNVTLVHEATSIGSVYGLCTQEEFNNKKIEDINFENITDYESW